MWNHRDQKFLIALAQTDAFANLRALKFSTFLYKDDDDEKPVLSLAEDFFYTISSLFCYLFQNPYQNLFIGCPNLEHLQFGYLCSSPKNVESLCKGLTSRAASHLKSLGLNFSDGIVAKKSLKVLLASLPPSLEVVCLIDH